MKVRHVICCSAVAVLPQLALAATPSGEFGAFQAVFDSCAKVDPAQSKYFGGRADSLFRGLTKPQVAKIRQSAEYKRGYQLLATVLHQMPANQAAEGCGALVPPSEPQAKPRRPEPSGRK
jgi:hypothetical protein